MNYRFVCDTKNATFLEFQQNVEVMCEQTRTYLKEVEAKLGAIDDAKQKLWVSLWTTLQAEGVIEAGLSYEDFSMEVNPETKQLFITPTSEKNEKLAEMLGIVAKKMGAKSVDVEIERH